MCPSVIRTMQRRLILLWNACTIYKDLQNLHPTQKTTFELWEHMQYCREEDCERKFCRSSCRIVGHFNRCKVSNRRSACELCAPVIKYIAKEYCDSRQLMSSQHCKIQMEMRVKRDALSQKQCCTVIRWDKSVKGGREEDSVTQVTQTNDVKKRPFVLQGCNQCTNKKTYKREKARNIRIPNRIISSGMQSANTSLVDICSTRAACCTIEEEREEIVDASRVLMRLKKRTWCRMFTDHNTTSTSTMLENMLSTSTSRKDFVLDQGQYYSKKIRTESPDDHRSL